MATTRSYLSGSTSGKPIPIAATATPGTTIHTAPAAPNYDSVFIFVSNVTGTAATLTIEFGGTSDPGDHLVKGYSIAPNSAPVPIAMGQVMSGTLVIKAFSGTANALNATGYILRTTVP